MKEKYLGRIMCVSVLCVGFVHLFSAAKKKKIFNRVTREMSAARHVLLHLLSVSFFRCYHNYPFSSFISKTPKYQIL